MSRTYSFIYSDLVEGDDDFVGHIAYSIYKSDKIKFIEEFKAKNNKSPLEADLQVFHDFSKRESAKDYYRSKAENILGRFVENAITEAKEEAEFTAIINQTAILKDTIKPLTPSYWSGVGQNMLASFLYTLLAAVVVFCLLVSSKGCNSTINDVTNGRVTINTGDTLFQKGK